MLHIFADTVRSPLYYRWRAGRHTAAFLCFALSTLFPFAPSFAQHNNSEIMPIAYYEGEYVVTLPKRRASDTAMFGMASSSVLDGYGVAENLHGETFRLSVHPASGANNGLVQQSALGSLVVQEDLFCKQLLSKGIVSSCTPNYQLKKTGVGTNDPLASELWGLSAGQGVNAEGAWELSSGSRDLVVAIIDTGIDYNHPDLESNLWRNPGEVPDNGLDDDGNGYVDDVYGLNAISGVINPGDPFDDNGHGTHVAGTIGAVGGNEIGVVGVAPNVKLMGLKFLDSSGSGRLSDAITAIQYMVTMKEQYGVNVVVSNNSWGGGGYSPALEEAIRNAYDAGILFVAAAGNDGLDNDLFPSYPSGYEVPNVVSVAALDAEGNLASFSNYGAEAVDVAAPGVSILSSLPGNRYERYSGTSMASPHVAGVLALLLSIAPELSVEEAIVRLYESGRELLSLGEASDGNRLVATGRIPDAERALRNERSPVRPPDRDESPCVYNFDVSNVKDLSQLDQSADGESVVNQVDEGAFVRVELPFDFPFVGKVLRVVYISPNGVVYEKEPRGLDYLPSFRAPNFAIAAFHADLIPKSAAQGVRVYRSDSKVTIAWLSELYAMQGAGPVSVRLTLYPSGHIVSTISFEEARDGVALSRIALGDPFQEPVAAPLGVVGVGGASSSSSSTLDLLSAQRSLVSSAQDDYNLRIEMHPTCEAEGGVPEVREPEIKTIRGRRRRKQWRKFRVSFIGEGSGDVPIEVYVDRRICEGGVLIAMQNGIAEKRIRVPRSLSLLSMVSSSGAKMRTRFARPARMTTKGQRDKICERVLRSLR